MLPPQLAAEAVLDSYYSKRGEESPRLEAARLVNRVRFQGNKMTGFDDVDLAEDILIRSSFDVDDLAEFHLGIDLRVEHLDDLDQLAGAKVFGVAEPRRRRICICERATRYPPLYRTTVMHEVGHVELHTRRCARLLNYAPFAQRRPPEEREADTFMHAALLPEDILLLAIPWVAKRHDLDAKEAILWADTPRGRYQWHEYYFPEIISRLCVSRHLICIKLRQMGVFRQRTVQYHLSRPARPNKWMNAEDHRPLRRAMAEIERGLLVARHSIAS